MKSESRLSNHQLIGSLVIISTAILLFVFRGDILNFYHFTKAALFIPAFISIFFVPVLYQGLFEQPAVFAQAFIYVFSFLFVMYIGGLIASLTVATFYEYGFVADVFTFFGGASAIAIMDSLGAKENT